MEIKWLHLVIDLPADRFGEAADFWVDLTATTRGPVHPEHAESVQLVPASGDMHLELQRIDAGSASVHLDLLVEDIPAWTQLAVDLGARLVADPGHAVLETPGGAPFCIVPFASESERAPVIDAVHRHAVDQICIDVPHDRFEADVAFWSALTGWAVNPPVFDEFRSFAQPDHLPIRLLVQRLGADDGGGARSHLDISGGEHVVELVERHVARGAELIDRHEFWATLRDPAGQAYCITARDPERGASAVG